MPLPQGASLAELIEDIIVGHGAVDTPNPVALSWGAARGWASHRDGLDSSPGQDMRAVGAGTSSSPFSV